MAADLALTGAGAPSVKFTYPAADSVLLSRTVDICGTAQGSDSDWVEDTQQQLRDGTLENVTADSSGKLALSTSIYDDFEDGALDLSKWSVDGAGGIGATEAGGFLRLNGTATSPGCWTSACTVLSTATVSDRVRAVMTAYSYDSPSRSLVGMYQDPDNYMMLGMDYDADTTHIPFVSLVYSTAGTPTVVDLGDALPPHVFEITLENGWSRAFVDGVVESSRAFTLGDHKGIIYGAARYPDDWLNALWHNVSFYYCQSGNYTSSVYDTLSTVPVLKTVGWNETVPDGTGLLVAVRSADDVDMTDPTPWKSVSNGQNTGLPAMERYLQYRVSFGSIAGTATPTLHDMNITYQNAISKVETSVDGQKSWQKAQGAEDWHAQVELGEGAGVIWVRAIDVLDNVQTNSMQVNVDTVPPTGWVSINGGANYASAPEVSLSLMAFDHYGVKSMILSEDPQFPDAEWQNYSKSLQWTFSAGDGNKTVYVKYMDVNGWESELYNGTIVLDTAPPAGSVLVNGGAAYTRDDEVRLALNATDPVGVALMMVSNSGDFADASWQDYQPAFSWMLEPGDGQKTVWAKYRDYAGLDSDAASASVILDTQAPAVGLSIGDGGPFARSTQVTLNINATDNFVLGAMMISASPSFAGASWEPYSAQRCWTFPAQEGAVTLFAKVTDAAGNEAPSASASVTLDTSPPVCIVSSLPAEVTEAAFPVRWNGSDPVSGVRSYDVQYKEGNGTWTGWLTGVAYTSAQFTGQDNRTYSFRARSTDNAGNVGAWPDRASNPVTVRLAPVAPAVPLVTVEGLEDNSTLHGKVVLKGTARKGPAGRDVTAVQLRIDDGQWQNATGTLNWTYRWDTAAGANGRHAVHIRAFDGLNYSEEAVRTISVGNSLAAKGIDAAFLLVAVVVIAAAAGVAGAAIFLRRKRPATKKADDGLSVKGGAAGGFGAKGPSKDKADAQAATPDKNADEGPAGDRPASAREPSQESGQEPVEGSPAAAGDGLAGGQSPAAAGDGLADEGSPGATVAGTDGEAAAATERSGEPAPERQAGPTPEQRAQTLALLRGLHPGLPNELRALSPELLEELVSTAERGTTPKGQPTLLIMGRWYFGDDKNEFFLRRFNW